MLKLLLICSVFDISMDELCGRETKTEAERNESSLNSRRKFDRHVIILLAIGLLLGFVGGYLGHAAIQGSLENDYIFDNIKITNFSFSRIYTGNDFTTLQISFSTNISNSNLKYQVVRTDSDGNSIAYDAEYDAGICKCKMNLNHYFGYTLTAVISDGKNIYTAGLIKFDNVQKDGLTYQELWNT